VDLRGTWANWSACTSGARFGGREPALILFRVVFNYGSWRSSPSARVIRCGHRSLLGPAAAPGPSRSRLSLEVPGPQPLPRLLSSMSSRYSPAGTDASAVAARDRAGFRHGCLVTDGPARREGARLHSPRHQRHGDRPRRLRRRARTAGRVLVQPLPLCPPHRDRAHQSWRITRAPASTDDIYRWWARWLRTVPRLPTLATRCS
jgi:hypothetical protein